MPRFITNALSVPNNWFAVDGVWPAGTYLNAQWTVLTTVIVSAEKLNSQNIHLIWEPIPTSVELFLSALSVPVARVTVWLAELSCARWLNVTSCLLLCNGANLRLLNGTVINVHQVIYNRCGRSSDCTIPSNFRMTSHPLCTSFGLYWPFVNYFYSFIDYRSNFNCCFNPCNNDHLLLWYIFHVVL